MRAREVCTVGRVLSIRDDKSSEASQDLELPYVQHLQVMKAPSQACFTKKHPMGGRIYKIEACLVRTRFRHACASRLDVEAGGNDQGRRSTWP